MIDPDEIAMLARELESDRVERTESLKDNDKFCKAICAFANDMPQHSKPGYLLVGVNKQGSPTGAPITEDLLESLASKRRDGNIQPLPTIEVASVPLDGTPIAVVKVHPSDAPPVRYKGIVWIRVGPSARPAHAEEERRLSERRVDRARTWDCRACDGATIEDLALELFALEYLHRAVSSDVLAENGRTMQEQLSSLRFFNRDVNAPTNAAILTFGSSPETFVPGAYVQYVRYDGTSLAADVLEERRFTGDLRSLLTGLDQLARQVAVSRPFRAPDLSEFQVADYPAVALHELLMNAVIHRNYEGSTTPVSINHFTDRIEIQNPGGLFGDLRREDFPRITSYRNPVLAEAAKTLGFVNKFGRGIALANDLLRRNGSPPLDHMLGDNHVLAIVRRRP